MPLLLFTLMLPLISWGAIDHDHASFTSQLQKFTTTKNGQTHVQYGKWKKEGKAELEQYLKTLSSVKKADYKSFSADQRLAFLINAYNAFTVKLIVDNYPLKSIKDTGSVFTSPWKKEFFSLLGEESYLDKIEHEMIRKEFNEPRIHFAVNCASIGCPSLLRSAFTGKGLNQELTTAEEAFFKNPAKFNAKGEQFNVSKILDWYGDDFREKHGSLEGYLAEKAATYKVSPAVSPEKIKVTFLNYDWNLNGE